MTVQVRRPRQPHAQDRRDHLRAPVQATARPPSPNRARQVTAPAVQPSPLSCRRSNHRSPPHTATASGRWAARAITSSATELVGFRRRVIPPGDQLRTLGRVQHPDLTHPRTGGSDATTASTRVNRGRDRRRRRRVEQVRRRQQPSAQPVRSAFGVVDLTQQHAQVEPGRRGSGREGPTFGMLGRPPDTGAAFACMVSSTWNSGWRPSDRSGTRSSTSRSNGNVLMVQRLARLRAHPGQQRRNVGSPVRSARSTSVLTKKPTRSSRASSVRPAIPGADRDVVSGAELAHQDGHGALQHHEQGHALSRARAASPGRGTPAGTSNGREAAVARDGRRTTPLRRQSAQEQGGDPASASRHQAT